MDEIEEREQGEHVAAGDGNSLSVLQAVGLVVLLFVLQVWVQFLIEKSGSQTVKDTAWIQIVLMNGLSGLVVAQAGAWLMGRNLFDVFGLDSLLPESIVPVILAALGASIISSEIINVLHWIRPVSSDYLQFVTKLTGENAYGVLLAVGIVAPVTEELIFRGIMLDGLRNRYSLPVAVLISSGFFGLIHGLPWLMVNAFLLSLFYAWLKITTRSLIPCILAHFLYNALPSLPTLLPEFQIRGFTTTMSSQAVFQPLWFDLVGLGLLLVGIHMLSRKPAAQDTAS